MKNNAVMTPLHIFILYVHIVLTYVYIHTYVHTFMYTYIYRCMHTNLSYIYKDVCIYVYD